MKAPDRVLVLIDANSSGVSGDMYLGALVDMGGRVESLRKVARVVAEYLPGTSDVDVNARRVERGGIGGHLVTIRSEEKHLRRKGSVILTAAWKSSTKIGMSDSAATLTISPVQTFLHPESS